jgi:hypothetical protein
MDMFILHIYIDPAIKQTHPKTSKYWAGSIDRGMRKNIDSYKLSWILQGGRCFLESGYFSPMVFFWE